MNNNHQLMTRGESPGANTAVATVSTELSIDDVKHQVGKIQELMKGVMREGEHFGNIPGTDKPTLLKSGAEKLGFTFRLAPRLEGERAYVDLGNGHREYIIKCELYHALSGAFFGSGIGSCSTMESKYRYRWNSGFDILDDPIPDDYRQKKQEYKKQGFGAKKVEGQWCWVKYLEAEKIENPDIADVYNTVLKMATKRAHIAAILYSLAASDIFTQDVEDIPAEVLQGTNGTPTSDKEHESGRNNGKSKAANGKKDPDRQKVIDEIVTILKDDPFTEEDRQEFKKNANSMKSIGSLKSYKQKLIREKENRLVDQEAAADYVDADYEEVVQDEEFIF